MHPEDDQVYYAERLNKTAAKREIKQIEQLAHELTEMAKDRFDRLKVDGELRAEIELARSTKGHGSRKRQIKHLTAVLRRDDESRQRLQEFIEGTGAEHFQEVAAFHKLEELRDRLCTFETMNEALAEVKASWPLADVREIEKCAKRSWAGKDRTAYRKVFRLLKQVSQQATESESPPASS